MTHFGSTLLPTEVKDRESSIADVSLPVYHSHNSMRKKQRKTTGEMLEASFPLTGACEVKEAPLI